MTELEAIRKIISNGHELGRMLVNNNAFNLEEKVLVERLVREIIAAGYTRLNQIDIPKGNTNSTM